MASVRKLIERRGAELAQIGRQREQKLSAQVHAAAFYERLGFHIEGDEYLEAGIPHVMMVRHSD